MGNSNLAKAKDNKQDEFYTQMFDINNELIHYKDYFRGKTVLCNCDDPRVSNFTRFFVHHFELWGLKRLISVCYKNQDIDLFSQNDNEQAVYMVYDGDKNGNKEMDNDEIEVIPLKGDGDFRSRECIELLKQADVVVTNPPFSLFREYISQLIEYKKDFLIIGNQNAITYKEVFSLIQTNKVWLGYKFGDMKFRVPDYYEPRETRFWIDEEGNKWRSLGNVCWFTNIPTKKRFEPLDLYREYNPQDYPHYINYNAIDVSKISDIPKDYFEPMGVPITFVDKYCPTQFEILGIDGGDMGVSYGVGADLSKAECTALFNEHRGFRRGKLSYRDENGKLQMCYRRIIIKRKQEQ